jgi:hypothetical protein
MMKDVTLQNETLSAAFKVNIQLSARFELTKATNLAVVGADQCNRSRSRTFHFHFTKPVTSVEARNRATEEPHRRIKTN